MDQRKPMTKEQRLAREREFDDRIQALLQEFADVVAPSECVLHGRDEDCTCDEDEARVPMESMMVREYVMGMTWTSMETGKSFSSHASMDGMLLSHCIGLLALTSMDYEDQVS